MRYLILGAAGFIGRNLVEALMKQNGAELTLFDRNEIVYPVDEACPCRTVTGTFDLDQDFLRLTKDIDVVYHLISTNVPGNSNAQIEKGFVDNVVTTMRLLEACAANKVGKVMFISSGGTVYGTGAERPLREEDPLDPISAYGLQKLTIEKTLYLYRYLYNLDYRIVRLANPYGKYKKVNGVQGVVNTFVQKAVRGEQLSVFGDGKVVRDYIHIDDAIGAILRIEGYDGSCRVFNVGSGTGHSINDILGMIEKIMGRKLEVQYQPSRKADVPVNVLNIERYENCFGPFCVTPLEEGIRQLIALEYQKQETELPV